MDTSSLSFDEKFKPKFNHNQKVFVMVGGRSGYFQDTIRSIYFKTYIENNQYKLCTVGYEIDIHLLLENPIVSPENITTDEEFAKKEMEFIEATLSEQEWQLAIGERDYDQNCSLTEMKGMRDLVEIEDSELGVCCGKISDIRDILLECKHNGGLNKRQIRRLEELLISHEPSTEQKYLGKILEKFELKWQET